MLAIVVGACLHTYIRTQEGVRAAGGCGALRSLWLTAPRLVVTHKMAAPPPWVVAFV